MIRYIFLTTILILVTLLEETLLSLMIPVQPNLLLVVTLAIFFAGRKNDAYFTALVGGLLKDLTTLNPLGLSSLKLLLTTGTASLIKQKIGSAKYTVSGFTFAVSVILRIFNLIPEPNRLNPRWLFFGSMADAILILLLAPAVAILLQSLSGKRELKVER